jgi:hypothetical protein
LKFGLLAMAENGGACAVPCRWSDDIIWQVAHQRLASVSPFWASAAKAPVAEMSSQITRHSPSARMLLHNAHMTLGCSIKAILDLAQ